jgi:hypothetical protein
MTADKKEHLYKILVIGELGTGKTSNLAFSIKLLISIYQTDTVNLLRM